MTDEKPAKTRVIIADDEPLARARLRMLLAEEPWLDLIAECSDGPSTIAAIEKFRPELVFLDVQMLPDRGGKWRGCMRLPLNGRPRRPTRDARSRRIPATPWLREYWRPRCSSETT
jgi:DNA-binding LytR/AlgR family response regulator